MEIAKPIEILNKQTCKEESELQKLIEEAF